MAWLTRQKDETVATILAATANLKYKMIVYSFVIGLMSGGVIVLYRLLGEYLLDRFLVLYTVSGGKPLFILLTFLLLIAMSLVVTYFVKQEPNISGSGIPQVKGMVTRRLTTDWRKVLFYKFFGGLLALAAGLSVGREGPSIQMGAAVGQGVSNLSRNMDYEHKYLITSGAAAGLAAAFNAPVAGLMFALEEVHKNFSPIVLVSAMVSAVTADMVTKFFLGINPALRFALLSNMPIHDYWSLILLGVIVGISSYLFNHGLLATKHAYRKLPLPLAGKIMIPFLCAGILGFTYPAIIGGGHHLIMSISTMKISLLMIFLILMVKYLFTFVSFGSGVPGGIFLPLLAIGALIGNLFGTVCITYFGIPPEFIFNFTILAMAGHFAAIVKAPITGIILIFEMTGSFEQLLPLTVVVFTALVTSDALGVRPVYDMLLDDILKGSPTAYRGRDNKKTLLELSVHLGSEVEGKHVSQINWPSNCLVVAIYRGSDELIPRGNTLIVEGDMLLVMVDQVESAQMLDVLTGLTS